MKKLILILSIILLITNCFAQSQTEMNQQAGGNYQQAEKELNRVYQQILKEYNGDTLFIKKMKTAERLWIKFRDAEVEMMWPNPDFMGSGEQVCVSIFLEQMTRERIKKLKMWTEGAKEDMCSGSTKRL